MSYVMKLKNGNLVLSEKGKTRVVNPPKGVSFCELTRRFVALLWDKGEPVRAYFPIKGGIYAAYYTAMETRRDSVGWLLTQRVLSHQVRKFEPTMRDGFYLVHDPIKRVTLRTTDRQYVEVLREMVSDKWIAKYHHIAKELPYGTESRAIARHVVHDQAPQAGA